MKKLAEMCVTLRMDKEFDPYKHHVEIGDKGLECNGKRFVFRRCETIPNPNYPDYVTLRMRDVVCLDNAPIIPEDLKNGFEDFEEFDIRVGAYDPGESISITGASIASKEFEEVEPGADFDIERD